MTTALTLPEAATLIGVMDEEGVLEYGEVFLQVQPPDAPDDAKPPEPPDPANAQSGAVAQPAPERLAPQTSLTGSARDQVNADGELLKPSARGPRAGLREKLGG